MGKICLTQVLKDLDGEPMTIGQPGLPPVIEASEADVLDQENVSKYDVRGKLWFLKKRYEKKLLFRAVLTGALLHRSEEEDKSLTPEDLMVRFTLTQRVHEAETFSFTAEQIVMLKKLINRKWAPINMLIAGRAFEMLEPKEEDKEDPKHIPDNGHIPSVQREAAAI